MLSEQKMDKDIAKNVKLSLFKDAENISREDASLHREDASLHREDVLLNILPDTLLDDSCRKDTLVKTKNDEAGDSITEISDRVSNIFEKNVKLLKFIFDKEVSSESDKTSQSPVASLINSENKTFKDFISLIPDDVSNKKINSMEELKNMEEEAKYLLDEEKYVNVVDFEDDEFLKLEYTFSEVTCHISGENGENKGGYHNKRVEGNLLSTLFGKYYPTTRNNNISARDMLLDVGVINTIENVSEAFDSNKIIKIAGCTVSDIMDTTNLIISPSSKYIKIVETSSESIIIMANIQGYYSFKIKMILHPVTDTPVLDIILKAKYYSNLEEMTPDGRIKSSLNSPSYSVSSTFSTDSNGFEISLNFRNFMQVGSIFKVYAKCPNRLTFMSSFRKFSASYRT